MNIKITVRNKLPICGDVAIVCNNSDYTVIWELDEEWSGYDTKTMRTVYKDGTYTDTVFTGNTVALPVVTVPGTVKIGLYAGDIRTSRPALIVALDSITTDGGTLAAPSEDVYNQLMERMAQLETPDWAQNDESAKDYVKNRPGGYTKTTPGYDITWDGVVGDRTVVYGNADRFVKVSDRALTKDELLGATVVVRGITNGTVISGDDFKRSYSIVDNMLSSADDFVVAVSDQFGYSPYIISILSAPCDRFSFYGRYFTAYFYEPGIYFVITSEGPIGIPGNITTSLSKAKESLVTVKIPGELTGMVGGYATPGSSGVLLDETIAKERFVRVGNNDLWDAEIITDSTGYDWVCGTVNGVAVSGRVEDDWAELYSDGDDSPSIAGIGLMLDSGKYIFSLYTEPTTDCEVHLTQYTYAKPVTIPREYIDPNLNVDVQDALNIAENAATRSNPVFSGTFSQNRKSGSVIGAYSFAAGTNGTASGKYSFAAGADTIASAESAYAIGANTRATALYAHAEGYNTKAVADCAHAEGNQTYAGWYCQFVHGYYNIIDTLGRYLHIVGNGDSSKRSNAYTLSEDGVPWYQGRPQFGGKEMDSGSQTVMANGDKEVILSSSTPNSTKQFKITVDDSGVISATEVVE